MDITALDLNKLSLDDLFKIIEELHDNESECIELKDYYLKPAEISDYITQFSNNRGGLLVFGITNDGKPSRKIKSFSRENEISIHEGDLITNPPVNIEIKPFELTPEECWIIVIKIPKPIDGILRMSSKGALVKRVGTRRANIEITGNIYEGRVINTASLSSLNQVLLKQFIAKITSKFPALKMEDNDLLKTFNLAAIGDDGEMHPTMAGLILFGIQPDVIVSGTRINILRYKTSEKSNSIEESFSLSGPILETIEETNKLVWTLTKKMIYFNSGRRDEISEYPQLAIREAINNAFFHNDYNIKGNIFVEMFPDRLEIKNMGIPLGGTRLSDLVGKPKYRNPTIQKVLHQWGYVEGWGVGLKTILEKCKTHGLPEPKLFVSNDETCLCFKSHNLLNEPTLDWISKITQGLTTEFNYHQILALAYVKHKERITNNIYQQINAVNNNVASNELRELCSSGILVLLGRGKNSFYSLAEFYEYNKQSFEKYYPKEIVVILKNPQKKILSIISAFGRISAKQIFYQSGYSDERGVKRILNSLVKLQLVNRIAKKPSDPSAYYEINKSFDASKIQIFDDSKAEQLNFFNKM